MNRLRLAAASASGSTPLGRPAPTLRRALRAAALVAGLALPLAIGGGAAAQEAAESTAITTLYTSLLSAVGKGAGEATVGWAMSAIGLSGGDSAQLAAIGAELQQIDADLKNINSTLNEIFDAIEAQTCAETQIASPLLDAVNDITELYSKYQTFVANAARTPPVPPPVGGLNGVLQWQIDVLAKLPGDLVAIHDSVYATVSANVIDKCAQATAAPYLDAEKTVSTFFDDRPSYAQLVDIVNYYYGVQVQGTAILVEAYNLQACQAAAEDDPDLHCDFTTVSSSTSASNAETICDAPTAQNVQPPCIAAEEAVTNPGNTPGGLYEQVEAWLTAAGAPYATDQLGIISSIASSGTGQGPASWDGNYAYLFPRDLLDFTNHATINGATVSDCASPLTSKSPCGPVGPYNAQFESGMSYGGINGHWKAVTADVLILLFEPYDNQSDGGFDVSGTLGDFMYSIGFTEAVKNNGLIVTTANTGKNGDTGIETICFMDTAAPRDKTKQPWCDGIGGGTHQGTDNLIDTSDDVWVQSEYLDNIASQPAFYTLKRNSKGEFIDDPGWFVVVQQQASSASDRAIYWQYHWPMTNVPEIGCQNGAPAVNPGGLLTRCAGDLQEYVDALLPPPDSDTTALEASADTTLLRDQPNRNDGRAALLRLAGGAAERQIVVRFDEDRLQQFLTGRLLTSARLRLSSARRGGNWRLEIRPLADEFVEGTGNLDDGDFGVGTGATWNCAEDADVSDEVEDCLQHWSPSTFDRTSDRGQEPFVDGPDRSLDHDRRHREANWDVSEDLQNGVHAWLIRVLHGAGRATYISRQGADLLRDPARAPTLLLGGEPLWDRAASAVKE